MNEGDELLEVVDRNGCVIRVASRAELHGNPSLIHRVVHVLVFDAEGRLLLQKRSLSKDIAPGKWDTSVGGHVGVGEDIMTAAAREMREELGISSCTLRFLYSYLYRNSRESELVTTYACRYDGAINFNPQEIDEVKFWDLGRIKEHLGTGIFSGHFESEIQHYLELEG